MIIPPTACVIPTLDAAATVGAVLTTLREAMPVPTVYAAAPSHFRPLRDTALPMRTMVRLGLAG